MTEATSAIYIGDVVHKRVAPVQHALRYRVFSLLIDCDALERVSSRTRLFSYNRPNVFSIYDTDHGDSRSISAYLTTLAQQAGMADEVTRFSMLCYPRFFGYAFNPLTVYFGMNARDRVCLVVYEVNNTFGERKTYVIPTAESDGGTTAQQCEKEFYVSPFNSDTGTYHFRLSGPAKSLMLGVALRHEDRPVLKAFFRASRRPLTDTELVRAVLVSGWVSLKVIVAIHFEAARLWLKGMSIVRRPAPPKDPITFVAPPNKKA